MNILIFSDTHHNTVDPIEIIRCEEKVDAVIHAGDCEADAQAIFSAYPNIPMYSVAGNCDFMSSLPAERTIILGGKKIFITHGHTYNVKSGLSQILKKAENYDLVVFGHTHKSVIEYIGNSIVVNPGSIKGYPRTYARATVENNKLTVSIKEL